MRLDYTEVSPGGVKAFGGAYGYVMHRDKREKAHRQGSHIMMYLNHGTF